MADKRHFALGRKKPDEMNKTEAAYDEHLKRLLLTGAILWYRFGHIKLKLAKNTWLTVDFSIMEADGTLAMHDTKGAKRVALPSGEKVLRPYVEDDAKVKMKVANKEYPFRFCYAYPKPARAGGGWIIEEL